MPCRAVRRSQWKKMHTMAQLIAAHIPAYTICIDHHNLSLSFEMFEIMVILYNKK
jgi:hypothetical protein